MKTVVLFLLILVSFLGATIWIQSATGRIQNRSAGHRQMIDEIISGETVLASGVK